MGSAIANIDMRHGNWNRPEEDLKDFPTNVLNWLAPINPVAVKTEVFMTGVWAPITLASARE